MPISVKRPLNSAYVHIPFCQGKCNYCSFVSLVNKNNHINEYINSLIFEIEHDLGNYQNLQLNSVYIGGGTPSLVEISNYELIMSKIHELAQINNEAEISIEVNPGTVNLAYLRDLGKLGINRLSIGVQSFDDGILEHNWKKTFLRRCG